MIIGGLDLGTHPVLLAPMENITDPSFRLLCRELGADMVFSEFVNSDGLIRRISATMKKMDFEEKERPVGIQIYGHLPASMVEAAKMAELRQPEVIDINFGCPSRKIARRGAGAGMLDDLPGMIEMTRMIVESVSLPVTVKTRLGTDESNRNILEIALRLQEAGIAAITIHGRTRSQLYKGEADWTLIEAVKSHPEIEIPVIGNGDIDDPEKAAHHFNLYGVDGIMIGRAAIGRPWIFREIRHYLDTGLKMDPPGLSEKLRIARKHLELSLEYKKYPKGLYDMRRHFNIYFRGLPNFRELRLKLLTTTILEEIDHLLQQIEEVYLPLGY